MTKLFNGLHDRIGGHPLTTRWLLAGPGALLGAYVLMAAMPLWFPPGAANIDQLVFPLILFPVLWAVLFFYACLAENLPRATGVIGAVIALNGAAAAWAALGGPAPPG